MKFCLAMLFRVFLFVVLIIFFFLQVPCALSQTVGARCGFLAVSQVNTSWNHLFVFQLIAPIFPTNQEANKHFNRILVKNPEME